LTTQSSELPSPSELQAAVLKAIDQLPREIAAAKTASVESVAETLRNTAHLAAPLFAIALALERQTLLQLVMLEQLTSGGQS